MNKLYEWIVRTKELFRDPMKNNPHGYYAGKYAAYTQILVKMEEFKMVKK